MSLFKKIIWSFFQILSIPFLIVLRFLLRIKVIYKNNILIKKQCLFISNHESKLDPFLIIICFGFLNYIKLIPFRFPVTPEFIDKIFTGTFIKLFGGYSIGKTKEEKAKMLFYTREILEKKGSVLIFPEAKLVKDGKHDIKSFHSGYSFLVHDDYDVVLVKIDNFHSLWKNFYPSNNRPSITYYLISGENKKENVLNLINDFYS